MALLNAKTDTQPRSINLSEAGVEYQASYFVYAERTEYWHYINAEITSNVYRDFYDHRSITMTDYSAVNLEWSITAEEYFRVGDLLSLRFFWYSNSGGAHPNHGVYTLNFAGDKIGRLELARLFGHNSNVANHVLEVCQREIQNKFYALGDNTEINIKEFIGDADLWHVFKQFSFSERGITLNLSPYSVLAYVYGSHEVTIPWDFFSDKIAEEIDSTELRRLIDPYGSSRTKSQV